MAGNRKYLISIDNAIIKKVIVAFLIITCIVNILPAQTLYAIVVAGTDMPDNILKKGITKSFNIIDKEIEKIPNYTNLNLQKFYLTGSDFRGIKLKRYLNNLRCNNNDVIFFYYIGHGFRFDNQDNRWPNLIIEYDEVSIQDKNIIPFENIINTINGKGARLTVMVAECCNNKIGTTIPVEKEIKGLGSLSFNFRNPQRYRELFLNSSGSVIASSSQPGETSVVSSEEGGYFTQAVVGEIEEQTAISNHTNWEAVFKKAKERTISLFTISNLFSDEEHIQHPQIEVNVYSDNNNTFVNWDDIITSNRNVFQQQPVNFQYNNIYQPQSFVVAKIVNFNNNGIFFLMSDNFIVKYDPFTGMLNTIGYRAASMQPQMFQWDFVNPAGPYQTFVYGVDYLGYVWEYNNFYGWQRIGAVYY